MSDLNDLIKFKCDFFDTFTIKEFKDSLVYDSKNKVFRAFFARFGPRDDLYGGMNDFFIVKNNKKHIPKQRASLRYPSYQTSNTVFVYEFHEKENVDLENGIYYKGFKVSDL